MELHNESEFKPVCSSIQSWLLVQTCPECHIEPRYDGKTPSRDKILPFEVHLKNTVLFVLPHGACSYHMQVLTHTPSGNGHF